MSLGLFATDLALGGVTVILAPRCCIFFILLNKLLLLLYNYKFVNSDNFYSTYFGAIAATIADGYLLWIGVPLPVVFAKSFVINPVNYCFSIVLQSPFLPELLAGRVFRHDELPFFVKKSFRFFLVGVILPTASCYSGPLSYSF